MSDLVVDYGSLPEDVREKLAELDLELSEGKCVGDTGRVQSSGRKQFSREESQRRRVQR